MHNSDSGSHFYKLRAASCICKNSAHRLGRTRRFGAGNVDLGEGDRSSSNGTRENVRRPAVSDRPSSGKQPLLLFPAIIVASGLRAQQGYVRGECKGNYLPPILQ